MNIHGLRSLSLGYLLLPNLLFYHFWFNRAIAWVAIPLLLYLFYTQVRSSRRTDTEPISLTNILVVAAFALLITLVSGTSGICYQTFDYWSHNTKYYDLFRHNWPLRMQEDGPSISYYFGYYVVPSLLAKSWNTISDTIIFTWGYIGFFLGLMWVYLALNRKLILVFLALTVGDLAHVFKTFFHKFGKSLYIYGDFGIEFWSNFENLLWVPNQVIPSMILAGMLFYVIKRGLAVEDLFFPIVLTLWWAVFPALTMLLLTGVLTIRNIMLSGFRINWVVQFQKAILPGLLCLPVMLFFSSHNELPISGFVWTFRNDYRNSIIEFCVNIGTNITLFLLLGAYFRKTKPGVQNFLFYVVVMLLFVFPFYRIGKVNDFLFRGAIPYLLLVGMYLYEPFAAGKPLQVVLSRVRQSLPFGLLLLLLGVSSVIAVDRIVRAAKVNRITANLYPDKVRFSAIPYDAYPNTYLVLKERWSLREANQYLGKENSFYELYLAPR
ncbi:hypothetical protein GCM10023187_44190 [Nibrella viscosa]|uniref:Uncharacterized protein n=1 Tax=Nibrella viscosa TaxID=1084524 RepID=A0ABP8KRL5_9BACT